MKPQKTALAAVCLFVMSSLICGSFFTGHSVGQGTLSLKTKLNVKYIEDSSAPGIVVGSLGRDGGTLVASTAKSVLELTERFVSVKNFGAVGDGVADDTAEIQEAIDYVFANGSSQLYFPAGTYKITSTITRPGGVILRGDGRGKTTINYTGAGTAIGVPTTNVRTYRGGVHSLTLTTTTGAIGIDLDSVSLANFERVDVTGFSSKGIRIISPTSGNSVYNRFWDVFIQGPAYPNTARGISIEGTSSNANVLSGLRTNLCFRGVHLEDSNDNTILASQFESGGTGIYVTSSLAGLCDWNRAIGCRLENNVIYGIDVATVEVRHFTEFGTWMGSNGTDWHDLGTKTRRAADEFYVNSSGTIQSDTVISGTNFALGSNTGTFQAATSTPIYLRGNVTNGASAVGAWIGNGNTLSTAGARVAGFCKDTPVTHGSPVAYIGIDGSYEYANGVKVMSGSGAPEGVVTATKGSMFLRTDGGAATTMYIKEAGTGNTGWAAK